ncbi:hypothetical protein FNF27_03101 [Cafeteria roenbergensis]|uniref:SKP1 component dimerisation domain-containing protein n=1 Tax=Cafeteria roenbergensis TaxID=33653 RepID=A0A5A8EHZ3_CAFRO|nr:hypothetical protein FNF31_01063 [Cafeteria roenbergensis]KAA0168826.1 hypothetical protein FNF28_02373 [Cafeteria roenbergensis]KAA0175401.1 hypothetical protein FNF27_03101 [Cafeteria roenbergensis]
MALSVIIKTTDDAEIKASRDLVTKYFGVVREFPGFGEEDDKEDNEEVPLSHSKTVIERMIAFAEKFNTEEFKPPRPIKKTKSLTEQGVPAWASEFNDSIPLAEKFELLQAADEVQFEGLVELMACSIAKVYVDMDPKVKAATFALSRDYTPEEEAAIRKEETWAEED